MVGPINKEKPVRPDTMNPNDTGPWVAILDVTEDYAFGDLFHIVRARLKFRHFDGRMSDPITRVNFERGDSVGVLLYDPQDDAVVLVRQFRYPVYASLDPNEREGDGARQAWTLEIVAGVQDAGRSVQEVANKELLEEAGYVVRGALQPITTTYPSPGGTSERIHLFWGEVDHRERAGEGGGVAAEGEETQVVVLPLREALDRVARGEIRDAKTIIALQHLALRQGGDTGGVTSP
jgi:ADP-ribose pyrophosphatase